MTTMDKTQKKSYQDIVDYKPIVLKVIDDEKKLKIFADSNYGVIISILRKKPMTVQEIKKAYDKEAEMCDTITKKSAKTIYRYLKVLEEVEMVVVAGQRVIIGKTASEKLYMRTARIFVPRHQQIDWLGEEGKMWAQRFGTLVSRMLKTNQEPSVECIQEFFEKWTKAKYAAQEKMASTAPDDAMEIITSGDLMELGEILGRVHIFGPLMNQPDLLEQMSDCFEEKTR